MSKTDTGGCALAAIVTFFSPLNGSLFIPRGPFSTAQPRVEAMERGELRERDEERRV
jgi:hypothetical protein